MLAVVLAAAVVLAVLAGAVIAAVLLHRRAGKAVEEAQRLSSLFDVIAEGILVCSGLQILAANTSICRQTGIRHEEVGDLMLSSFIRDTDTMEQLLSDRDVQIETQLHARDGTTVEVEVGARTIDYAGAPRRLLE